MKTIVVRPSYIRCKEGQACDILCFGESPGDEEGKTGEAFVGPAGQLLRDVLNHEFPKAKIVLDNTVPRYLNGAKPKKADIQEFEQYRKDSLVKHKPRVVLLLGKHAFQGAGLDAKPLKDCGKVVTNGCPTTTVLSVHPSYILRGEMRELHRLRQVCGVVRDQLNVSRKRRFPCLDDPGSLIAWLEPRAKKLCAFDVETSQLDPLGGGFVLTASICCEGKDTVWVPLFHPGNMIGAAKKQKMISMLVKWWPLGPRIVHNAMMEVRWMRHYGAEDPKELYDTLLQQWLLDENNPKGLDYLVTELLGEHPYWNHLDPANLQYHNMEEVGTYNCYDTLYDYRIFKLQRKRLTEDMKRIHDRILSPMSRVFVTMRTNGLKINRSTLKRLRVNITRRKTTLENKFRKDFNSPDLNFRSPKQLQKLLFEKMGLTPIEFTPTGQPKTDDATIDKLVLIEPRLKALHEIKSLSTLLSGALTQWDNAADEQDILRTDYGFGHVVTGRPSSSNPNLFNIDRRDKAISWKGCQRDAIVSRFRGGQIVQVDYAQQEYRLMMVEVGQFDVLDQIENGLDPHTATVLRLKERGHVLSRDIAKNCNFSLIYHGDEWVLWIKYSIPLEVGKPAVQAWYGVHPKVVEYHERVPFLIRRHGYIESMFGWRRRIPKDADQGEINQAINFPGQNPGALLTYMAMIDYEEEKKRKGFESLLVHTNYDSIVLDCPKKEVKTVPKILAKIMVDQADKLPEFCGKRLKRRVPLAVDIKMGDHL